MRLGVVAAAFTTILSSVSLVWSAPARELSPAPFKVPILGGVKVKIPQIENPRYSKGLDNHLGSGPVALVKAYRKYGVKVDKQLGRHVDDILTWAAAFKKGLATVEDFPNELAPVAATIARDATRATLLATNGTNSTLQGSAGRDDSVGKKPQLSETHSYISV